jgi:enoyl-CoA hydratase
VKAEAQTEREIVCERLGAAGIVVLDRPKALNALTMTMVRGLRRALDAWENEPLVRRVVVTAAGGRAFCAGGDIRQIYELGRAGRTDAALAFWREEYALNARIKRYTKPYISLIDGMVMGGGVGVTLHGSHRVAGERYVFAMPEVGIGFFPDVGATYALPRLPGETGTYLALTGDRVGQADALALGLATHAVASAAFRLIEASLADGEPVDAVLDRYRLDCGTSPLMAERPIIDACFSHPHVPAILAALDAAAGRGSAFAAKAAATMRMKSPTSLALALEQMRRGRDLNFEAAMRLEFRIASRVAAGREFYEGVRALIVDKDQAPRWNPPRIEDVAPADVAAYFAPLGARELVLP